MLRMFGLGFLVGETSCYVAGVASSGKVWCFLFFYVTQRLSSSVFHPYSRVGNSRLHSTRFNYLRFYGILHAAQVAPTRHLVQVIEHSPATKNFPFLVRYPYSLRSELPV